MQVVISSFAEVAKTGLTGAETLQKTDILYLFYGKGSDTMSFETHKQLSALKAKVEFKELENLKDFNIFASYLCGQYENKATKVIIVSASDALIPLANSKIIISSDLKSALSGRKTRASAPKTQTVQNKPDTQTRKPRTKNENESAPNPVFIAPENNVAILTAENKDNASKRTKKSQISNNIEGNINPPVSSPEAPAPEKKKVSVRASGTKAGDDISTFKNFMSEFKTSEFDAEKYAMTILSTVREAIRYNKTDRIEAEIANAVDIYGLKDASIKALKGKYKKIISVVKEMED